MAEKEARERVIMGIDPGTSITGYGVVRSIGSKLSLVTYGVIDMRRMPSDHPLKLKRIFDRTISLIEEFLPDEMAIEAPFQGKNVQSMLKLGRAQGVAMAAAMHREIPIIEYAPTKVKMAITGNGGASKEQVNAMVERLLQFQFDHEQFPLDASDGIAVALCHYLQGNTIAPEGGASSPKSGGKKKSGGWESFIANNPKRIR